MATAGYSGTPLVKKLGLKQNQLINVYHQPGNYFDLLVELPIGIRQVTDKNVKKDFIHYFTKDLRQYIENIAGLRDELKPNGMLWISWPKKAAKIPTDINEDLIRDIALKNGLVDIKVCAVDETWSALKLVIPVKQRSIIDSRSIHP